MGFSATDAAFEGFRVVRRAPLTIVFWSLFYLACFAAIFAVAGPAFIRMQALTQAMQGAEPSLAELQAVGQSFAWIFFLALPIMLLLGAVLNAAIVRSVLNPGDRALGYLRIGGDEGRVLVTSLVVGLVMFLAMIGVYLVLIGLGVAAYTTGQGWLWLVLVVCGLAGFAAVIWLSVRLSLASPIAVAEKRIAPFASFALTRGRFWPLLGMALLAGVMSMLVSLLASIVAMPVTLVVGGMERLAAYEGQDILTIITRGWPILLGWGLVQSITSALQAAVLYAPFSAAYQGIKGPTVEQQEAVFD